MKYKKNVRQAEMLNLCVNEGEEKNDGTEEILEEITAETFPKLTKKKKITDWKSVVKLKENKYKENYSWYF